MTLWRLYLMPKGGADGSREEKALRAQELCSGAMNTQEADLNWRPLRQNA